MNRGYEENCGGDTILTADGSDYADLPEVLTWIIHEPSTESHEKPASAALGLALAPSSIYQYTQEPKPSPALHLRAFDAIRHDVHE